MKGPARLLASALLCALPAAAQIDVQPTNYTHTISAENNLGKWWASWTTEITDTHALNGRGLTVSHTVYNQSIIKYWVQPKMVETRWEFEKSRSASYRMSRNYEIIYQGRYVRGGWITQTNEFTLDPTPYTWLPTIIGTTSVGNSAWRTITIGSDLELFSRNLTGSPRVLKLPISNGWESSYFLKSIDANATKVVTLGLNTIDAAWTAFRFNLDTITDEPQL